MYVYSFYERKEKKILDVHCIQQYKLSWDLPKFVSKSNLRTPKRKVVL